MQGKEASEQETTAKCNVGIDVGKDWLDIYVSPAGERLRVGNHAAGIRQLKRWLSRFDLGLVAIEATGKWHRQLHRNLAATAIPVAIVNPFQARMFAKAKGILAKTDRLDACVLAAFAAVMSPTMRPPAPQVLTELAELVTARDSAVDEQTSLKNQLGTAQSNFLKRQLQQRIKRAENDIAALEAEIIRRIRADQGLCRRYAILTSIPCIGPVSGATLIACLAEIGSMTVKQVGMLAGLAPIADQSGKRDGARVVYGGRTKIRRVLYLAALSAVQFNADMKAFYGRLIANGKEPKAALIAVARKLAILANTLVSQDRLWEPRPVKYA